METFQKDRKLISEIKKKDFKYIIDKNNIGAFLAKLDKQIEKLEINVKLSENGKIISYIINGNGYYLDIVCIYV